MAVNTNINVVDLLKTLFAMVMVVASANKIERSYLPVFFTVLGIILAVVLYAAYEHNHFAYLNIWTAVAAAVISVGVAVMFEIDTNNKPTSKCWNRFLRKWSLTLSTTIHQSDQDVILEWYSTANLICSRKKLEMFLEMQNQSEDKIKYSKEVSFLRLHSSLLADYVAMTGEECFISFCKIFLRNPKYTIIGLRMCKECEVCCSAVLNGNWSNASLTCSVPTELDLPLNMSFNQEKETIADFVFNGDNCRKAFKNKEAEIQRNLYPIMINVVNVDDYDDCQTKTRRCLVVHEASLFCSEEGLVARLIVNIEEEAIDQVKLKESIAVMTYVKSSQIELSIGPKNSTLVRLQLPLEAGMELLSIVSNSERKRLFLDALSSAICSLADYVSVSVQISALPPIKMFFVPKEATSWSSKGDLKFCAKSVEHVAKDLTYVFIEWIYFALTLFLVTVVYYTSWRHWTIGKIGGDKDMIDGRDRRTIIREIRQLKRDKEEVVEKNDSLMKENGKLVVKNDRLMKEKQELKGDRLLRIGYEMKEGGGEREHAQYQWKPFPQLPRGDLYWNRVATSQNKVIVADCWKNQFYLSDLHSSGGSWSTVVNTHSTSGGEVRSLFNAGDECFGTFLKTGEKQSIAKYTVKKNEWKHVTDIPSSDQLQYYGITADRDHVYIVGGGDTDCNIKDTVLVYDINTGTQCGRKKMNSKRRYCSLAIVGNLLFVVGGDDGAQHLNTVECIPLIDDCSHPRVAETPTYDCSLASLCGQLVMSGGLVGESVSSPVSNMVSVLSPSLNTWLPLPPMNQQRWDHSTCTVDDDTLMVVGGWTDELISLDSVEVLKF